VACFINLDQICNLNEPVCQPFLALRSSKYVRYQALLSLHLSALQNAAAPHTPRRDRF